MYAIVVQRETRLNDRDMMVEAAMDSTHVLGASGVQRADQQMQAAATTAELGDGEEKICADYSEQDEYGRCGFECDQCDESNGRITAGLGAFKLAYGRTTEPEEWRVMSNAERGALVEMSVQTTANAERQYGMVEDDYNEAIDQMASENLKRWR